MRYALPLSSLLRPTIPLEVSPLGCRAWSGSLSCWQPKISPLMWQMPEGDQPVEAHALSLLLQGATKGALAAAPTRHCCAQWWAGAQAGSCP